MVSCISKVSVAVLCVVLFTFQQSNAQVTINEVCAANGDLMYDPDFYNYPSWVELHNDADAPADISGFYLSDKPDSPLLWSIPPNTIIPAKGYVIIWCDQQNTKLHTSFSLDSDGEELILSNASGTMIDNVLVPKHPLVNISYGRLPQDLSTFDFMVVPSPGSPNVDITGSTILENPTVSMKSGRYSGAVTVTLTHPGAGVEIRYSLDGSEPNTTSELYSGPIAISATTTLKAKAYQTGSLPSKTEVKTYFINEHEFNLRVISISMDPKYLNDEKIGIYVAGTNGIAGRDSDTPVNWNQPWWRHADLEFFKRNGEKDFDKSVDLQISGNFSRVKPQKSFEIKARDKYGKSFFTEKLFPNKNIEKYKGFLLRNSGTEWSVTHFRDALTQHSTVGHMDVDYQDYEPYAIYLNGQYWGILNLREKSAENYVESNYNIAENEFDMLEKDADIISGTDVKYEAYIDSLEKIVDLENPASISFLGRNIDIQEYINYFTTNIYYSATDWPQNNIKYWAPKNGRFRWLLYDMDYSMNHGTTTSVPTYASLNAITDPNHPKGEWVTEHLRNALRNPIFKRRFISTMLTSLQTTFTSERLNQLITEFQTRLRPEMEHHMTKWNGSMNQWNIRVQQMRDFVNQRNAFLKQHYEEFFNLTEPVSLSVKMQPEGSGKFTLNGMTHTASVEDAYFNKGLPVNFNIEARPGYKFKHLKIRRAGHENSILLPKESVWKYWDKGLLPAENWTALNYDDAAWSAGLAQLGYGEGDEKTKVSFGPTSSNKYITTYFRSSFTVDKDNLVSLTASVLFDDGVVVYLNGAEVFRYNMPTGEITNTTLTTGRADNLWRSFPIPEDLLIDGENVLAIRVHQETITSTDLSFDFSLYQEKVLPMEELQTTNTSFDDMAYSDFEIEAVFDQINGIVINEVSSSNSKVKDDAGDFDDWIELFNSGTKSVDISGFYITDDLNNKTKYKMPADASKLTLEPGGYMLLWADEQMNQGPTHLNLKLSSDGESVGLYILENEVLYPLDELTYDAQFENQSAARYPNATGPFVTTFYLTPKEENTLTLPVERGEGATMKAFPNPTTGMIRIQFPSVMESVKFVDSQGKIVRDLGSTGLVTDINISGLRSGIYLVKATDGQKTFYERIIKQ